MYSSTWFVAADFFVGKEGYITVFLGVLIILFGTNFERVLDFRFSFSTIEKKIMLLILFLFLFSTFRYNIQDLSSFKGIINLSAYLVLIVIYFFSLPRFFDENPHFFEKFIKWISIFGSFFAILGIFILFFAPAPSGSAYGFVSIIKHPNLTSKVLTVTIFPTLYYIYWKRDSISTNIKYFFVFSLSLQIIAQALTLDRAGLIGNTIGLLLFFGLVYRSKIIYIIPIFAVLIASYGNSIFRAKGFASFVTRFYLLVPAFEMIFRSPEKTYWGYGITSGFAEFSKNLLVFYSNEPQQTDPHNSYVTLWLFFGLYFTVSVLFFVIILIIKGLKFALKSKDFSVSLRYNFLVSALIAILIQAIFDAEIIRFDYFTVQYLFVITGMIYLTKNEVSQVKIIKS